jgi:uncharacterized protein (DUF2236 family)
MAAPVEQIAALIGRGPVARAVKQRIVGQVRAVFNDQAGGEAPVQRSADALFRPDSVIWRVHGDVTTMMVGGIAALLLQMLHPKVLAGVWDHSNFRQDMLGRLRRTARFIAITTYGHRADAEAAIARVRRIHGKVTGTLPDGSPYRADDPDLLLWVHLTEAVSFLDAWIRYGEPGMSRADQDAYFAEMAVIGTALGVERAPLTRAAAEAMIEEMRPALVADARSRDVARIVIGSRGNSRATQGVQRLTVQAAIDLMPVWARRMHGLPGPRAAAPIVRAGIFGMASTLRWAFR